jgi:hypothetical protein
MLHSGIILGTEATVGINSEQTLVVRCCIVITG